jgi:excisionase family DNA binding protein
VPSVEDVRTAEELRESVAAGNVAISVTVRQGAKEKTVQLSEGDYPALSDVFSQIVKGKAVLVLPVDEELSTQQAADLLNVSRPYLIKLLEQNEIPFRTVGAWRRVRIDDVLAYKRKSDERANAAIQELEDQGQDLKMGY